MRKSTRRVLQYFAFPALAGAVWVSLPNPHAQARPQYLKQFTESYPALKKPAAEMKCGVCHAGSDKKDRNTYGTAVLAGLGKAENVKDPKAIAAALDSASKQPSRVKDQTFGDLINAGKLPE